jgi:hypothetical protein
VSGFTEPEDEFASRQKSFASALDSAGWLVTRLESEKTFRVSAEETSDSPEKITDRRRQVDHV